MFNQTISVVFHTLMIGFLGYDKRIALIKNKMQINVSFVNDPSAGSPTETLLRLLLPLNDQVWTSFQHNPTISFTL